MKRTETPWKQDAIPPARSPSALIELSVVHVWAFSAFQPAKNNDRERMHHGCSRGNSPNKIFRGERYRRLQERKQELPGPGCKSTQRGRQRGNDWEQPEGAAGCGAAVYSPHCQYVSIIFNGQSLSYSIMKGSSLKQVHLSYKNAARCIVSECKMNKEMKCNHLCQWFFCLTYQFTYSTCSEKHFYSYVFFAVWHNGDAAGNQEEKDATYSLRKDVKDSSGVLCPRFTAQNDFHYLFVYSFIYYIFYPFYV